MTSTRLFHFAVALTVGLAAGSPGAVLADDTEVFTGGNLVEGVRPNVLFVLDTSGSMSAVDAPLVEPRDRLEILQAAVRRLADDTDNINIGLMRFTDGGGPVLFPTRAIDADAQAIDDAGQPTVSVRVAFDEDDAEELAAITTPGVPAVAGDVTLDSAYLELMDTGGFGPELQVVRRVDTDADDAEQSESFYNNNSGTLEMVFNSTGNGTRTLGFRFENIENADRDTQRASVLSSRLTLNPQSSDSGPLDVKVFGLFAGDMQDFPGSGGNQAFTCPGLAAASQDTYCRLGLDTPGEYTGNPLNFGNVETYSHIAPGTGNITDAVVLWSDVPDTQRDVTITSPDLTPVIQEIFNHPQWGAASGNDDLGLFITGTTSNLRRIDSHDASANQAARLEVEYVRAGSPAGRQVVAYRFRNVDLPRDTDIDKAVLELVPVNDTTAPVSISIRAEKVPSSQPFTAFVNGVAQGAGQRLSARLAANGTSAETVWNLTAADAWQADSPVQTPDLKAVLEEVAADPGWCGGNDLVIFMEYETLPLNPQTRRVYAHDGNPSFAPRLNIDFDPDQYGPGEGCTVDEVVRAVAGDRDDAEQNIANGVVNLVDPVMEMTDDGTVNRANGVIFRGVQIPKNAVVKSAIVEFTSTFFTLANAANVTVRGISNDVVPPFSSTPFDISNRVVSAGTTATRTFSMPSQFSGFFGPVPTEDISSVVQEIVSRPDWDEGDDIGLVFTGSGRANLRTFDGNPAQAPRLRASVQYNIGDKISSGLTPTVVTVRERIKELVNAFNHSGNTPIVDTLLEGVSYFRGDPVRFGRVRRTPLNTFTTQLNTRLSHPASYTGGSVFYPPGCNPDDSNLSASECRFQEILGSPVYTSPIQESCQTNYIIFLTDGLATSNSSRTLVESLIGQPCQTALSNGDALSNDERCGIDLAKFAFDNDMDPDVAGINNVVTYTVGYIAPDANNNPTPPANADPNDINVPYLQEMAAAGGGQFLSAGNEDSLVAALKSIFTDVLSRSTSFAAPSLSVNAFNRLEDRNEVYFSLFEPSDTAAWPGNIKKFQLCQSLEADGDDCDEPPAPDVEIGDVLDARSPVPSPAIGADGRIVEDALSFWSSEPDGADTTLGGAANQVPDHTARTVYTLSDEALAAGGPLGTALIEQSLGLQRNRVLDVNPRDGIIDNLPGTAAEQEAQTRALLGLATEPLVELAEQIDWIRGRDVDNRFDDADFGQNRFAMGDPLHGNPLAITYGGTADEPVIKLIAGTNDGGIRLINTFNGIEEWLFIPPSLMPTQLDVRRNATGDRVYGVDGSATPLIFDQGPSPALPNADFGVIEPQFGDFVNIVIGQRRGGNNYWMLDLTPATEVNDRTVTNAITPEVVWRIRGGTPEFPMLGQTWSKPVLASLLVGTGNGVAAERRQVFIFAGGYEPNTQDAGFGPVSPSSVGNAIYVVDAFTGERLFYAGGPDARTRHGGGTGVEVPQMTFPIPSDVAAFDSNGDGSVDRLYVGDNGGQMWRVDLFPNRVDGVGGVRGVVGRLAVVSSDAALADQRKFFFAPTVIQVRGPGSQGVGDHDLVSAVTGNRANPLNTAVRDRFYAFRDFFIGPLLDADGNGLADSPTATTPGYVTIRGDLDGAPGASPPVIATTFGDMIDLTDVNGLAGLEEAGDEDALELFTKGDGWYIRLQETGEGNGEKGLAGPTTIAGRLFFTTFLPEGVVDTDRCTLAEGQGLLYGLDAITGAAIFNFDESPDGVVNKQDRVYRLGAGIPSSPVPVFFPEKVMLLVGIGGGAETVDPEIVVPRERTYWFQEDVQ